MSEIDSNKIEGNYLFEKENSDIESINNFDQPRPPEPPEKDTPARATDRGDDVVWQYMHAMGQISLLDRETEIKIAKKIEAATHMVMSALSRFPFVSKNILDVYGEIIDEENDQRNDINYLISGLVIDDEEPTPPIAEKIVEEDEAIEEDEKDEDGEGEDEDDSIYGGLDLEEVHARIQVLQECYQSLIEAMDSDLSHEDISTRKEALFPCFYPHKIL